MDPERWERTKKLFEQALEQDPGYRSAFLARAAAGDESIRAEVERLLAGHDRAGSFLQPEISIPNVVRVVEEPPETFSPGEVLCGRFKVIRFICKGGMGEVYEARDLELGDRLALKTLRPEILANPDTIKRFKHEIQLGRKVTHPNVCRIFDLGYHRTPSRGEGVPENDVAFLTMELLEGETLGERLRRQSAMTTAEALPLVRQMAGALAAAHDAGVIHRDFKPANVMLVPSPDAEGPSIRAVVTDFGLARGTAPSGSRTTPSGTSTTSFLTGEGTLVGTLAYMAPEQLDGGEVTPATDIYALGLVMYEMVTGQKPFHTRGPLGGAARRIREPAPSPCTFVAGLDRRWETAILRCLEIDPAARFRSAREVLQELDRETASPPKPHLAVLRRMWREKARPVYVLGSLAALAMVLIGLNFIRLRRGPHVQRPPTAIKSLAVLPLENLSREADQNYFADGITDELITDLGKIGALRVISRTSVMQYQGVHKPVSEVARALRVDAVVEGTVFRSGNRVRITARLIDARTGAEIWGESYERDLRDVLALQSEVATTIAAAIQVSVTSQEQERLTAARPVNTEAFEAYLRGRYEWNKDTERGWHDARDYFEQAVKIDPKYAPAYSGLADYYWATDELPPSVAMPEAKRYALEALKLDPNLAEAYTSLGVVQFYADWDWPRADQSFQRALELDPGDASAHRMYSAYLSCMGRSDEALEEARTAERLDPVSIDVQVTIGWGLYYARRYEQAVEQCRDVVDMESGFPGAHDCLGEAYLATKSYEKAIAESRKAVELSHNELDVSANLARAEALGGRTTEARSILHELLARSYVAPSLIAQIYIALDQKKEGLAWLEKAYADRDGYIARLKVDPAFDGVRSDPHFQAIMRRLNFPP
jgi:eukaryotic-like serine/threonine-protein kinase